MIHIPFSLQPGYTEAVLFSRRVNKGLSGKAIRRENTKVMHIQQQQTVLLDWFRSVDSCIIAFSGGLDSSVVAKAANLALGENALAVMATSPTCFHGEIEEAEAVAQAIRIRFVSLPSEEMQSADFIANSPQRCYYCKQIRFRAIRDYALSHGFIMILDGSNADDATDYRPGRRAVDEFGLRSPLAELGFDKKTIRRLARSWNLPNSEKPASPCLATRIAYGLEITEEKLRRIEGAENVLHSLNFSSVRVRLHSDELARIEVDEDQASRLFDPAISEKVIKELKKLGFHYITVDLEGFRSGSMNVDLS